MVRLSSSLMSLSLPISKFSSFSLSLALFIEIE
jgi:hypothetical protein